MARGKITGENWGIVRISIVRYALLALSGGAVAIGLMIYVGGPHFAASVFSSMLSSFAGYEGHIDDLSGPNIGSEMRFYAIFWIAYGGVVYRASRNIEQHRALIYLLLGLFFAGGVGRIISLFVDGSPDTLFYVLMWIELLFPPTLVALMPWPNRTK